MIIQRKFLFVFFKVNFLFWFFSFSSTYNSVLWKEEFFISIMYVCACVCVFKVRSVIILYLLLNPSLLYIRHFAIDELIDCSVTYKCLLLLIMCVYTFIQIVCLLNEICLCVCKSIILSYWILWFVFFSSSFVLI